MNVFGMCVCVRERERERERAQGRKRRVDVRMTTVPFALHIGGEELIIAS